MTTSSTDFKFGQVTTTAAGLSKLQVHEQSIQVQRLDDGKTCLTFFETGRLSAVFHLTPEQAIEFAVKLKASAGISPSVPAEQGKA